mgnify:CR=1 FL=1
MSLKGHEGDDIDAMTFEALSPTQIWQIDEKCCGYHFGFCAVQEL